MLSAIDMLSASASQTPRLDAEVLMAFVLGWGRAHLYGHWDEPLDEIAERHYQQLVRRRVAGEPIAYIRGYKEFLGLQFLVDARVLIPRPETELLVERVVGWLVTRPDARVVDIGTGSGAVAIGIAREIPAATVLAVDISQEALTVAGENAKRHEVSIDFRNGSLLEPIDGQVDLVVANLPYLSRDEYEDLRATSIAFEPRLALTDEADGLTLFRQLFEQVPGKLTPGGAVLLEIGALQPDALAELVREQLPGFGLEVFADYAGLPRVLELTAPGR